MAKKGKITIDREMCKGCYLCIRACPVKVLEADNVINSTGSYPVRVKSEGNNPAVDKCTQLRLCIACGNCYEVCPDVCIEVYEADGAA